MIPYPDFDNTWRLTGHEKHRFSSEADAKAAAELAKEYALACALAACSQESRYRRAAERAKVTG